MHEPLVSLPSLDEIADRDLDGLNADTLAALYERASIVKARLGARLLTLRPRPSAAEPDRVLGIEDAAALLGMSTDFLYRQWVKLGLGYKDADGHVKFSLHVVQRYIRKRSGR